LLLVKVSKSRSVRVEEHGMGIARSVGVGMARSVRMGIARSVTVGIAVAGHGGGRRRERRP
jgi:hypothetical protein